jgi:hypothetical protein
MSRRTGGGANTLAFVVAAAVGIAGGWLLAQSHDTANRHGLFARSAWRRFAALGWLERHGDAEAIGVLRDYLAWERQPTLRARGRSVLAALEAGAA